MNNITENVLQIIAKHKSATIEIIYKDLKTGYLRSHRGVLKNMNSNMIQVTSDNDPSGLENIRFFEGGTKKIYAIYNKNSSELLSLKANKALNVKLRNPELQKEIIRKVKPELQKEVALVIKKDTGLSCLNGVFTDLGIMDVSIKPAPFFNTTERVRFGQIMSMYNKTGYDVLEV